MFFDKGGCPSREALLPEYKANRGAPPEGFCEQLSWVKRLTEALGYFWHEEEGMEADDLIASAVRRKSSRSQEILIVSSDKDLAQLVDENVRQLLPPPTANPKLGWRVLDVRGSRKIEDIFVSLGVLNTLEDGTAPIGLKFSSTM